jgi:hypothetical protein
MSYLPTSSTAAAETAAQRKETKYAEIPKIHIFILSISDVTDDPRESSNAFLSLFNAFMQYTLPTSLSKNMMFLTTSRETPTDLLALLLLTFFKPLGMKYQGRKNHK